jgi:hypothetical protein
LQLDKVSKFLFCMIITLTFWGESAHHLSITIN